MNFNELNLRAPIQKAIAEFGYTTPSPIQQKAIPPVLEGRDLIGCAQTGTGKTAAFALPMLERLAQGRRAKAGEIRALILTPTRELALQIGQNFTDYGKYTRLRHAVIFGGVGQQPQVDALKRGLDVLIACPGRLNDLSNQGHVNLNNLEIFVLDEADRMLDMGFVHDVKRVVAKLPAKRQSLMFSATMPKEIEALANTFLTNPVMVKVNPVSSTVEKIEQSLYFVEKGHKLALLIHLLKTLPIHNALVFSRTKHGADKIVKQLEKAGVTAAAIHGNKGQNARVTALENFKSGQIKVLVATDIAARGIDINELSHVFNFDLPEVPETYVHRIGRTARAGADGVAISFCASEEKEYLQGIEKLNRKKIPVVQEHPLAGKPNPIKAVIAPLRGRKPVADAPRKEAVKPARTERKAQGKPVPARRNEEEMQEKQNRTPRNAQGGGQNNQRNQNQRGEQNRNAAGRAAQGQGRQGSRNQNGGNQNARGAAQPKFDPRFLTPQAAQPVANTAVVANNNAPAQQMLDVRRMNQSRNQNNSNNNRGGQNRGAQGANRNAQGGNRNAPRPQSGAQQAGGQNNTRGNAQPNRGATQNATRTNTGAQANRGTAQNNQRSNAPQNRGNTQGGAPRAQTQQNRTANSRFDRNDRDRNDSREPRNTRNDRSDRSERNDRNNASANSMPQRSAGKPNHNGLKTVRSAKPMRTNEKDPGLVLITKKPPQQKFTSFDDYMTAHGGATAPIQEQGDK